MISVSVYIFYTFQEQEQAIRAEIKRHKGKQQQKRRNKY